MTRKADRDSAIEQLLRGTVQPAAARAADDCPSADDLAAFVEGTIHGAARETVEGHAAGCDRCQAMLATMAELPAIGPSSRTPWHGRFRLPSLRWLVPATAVAGAVVLFVIVLQPRGENDAPKAPASVVARLPGLEPRPAPHHDDTRLEPAQPAAATGNQGEAKVAAAHTAPSAAVAPEAATRRRPAIAERMPSIAEQPAPRPFATKPEQRIEQKAGTVAAAPPSAPADALGKAPIPVTELQMRADSAQKAATSAPTVARAEGISGGVAGGVAGGVVGGVVAAPEAPPKGVATAARLAKPTAQERIIVAESNAAATFRSAVIAVVTPDSQTRWYVGPAGTVSRVSDGVARRQESGTQNDLLAGSALSPTTCWLAGRQGTVLRTLDGEHWQTRPFPEQIDLVAITAADARSATVTARDGRRFVTSDGGVTWAVSAR